MLTFLLTIVGVFLALGGMGLGVMLGALCGKRRRRLCACAEAKRVATYKKVQEFLAEEAPEVDLYVTEVYALSNNKLLVKNPYQ